MEFVYKSFEGFCKKLDELGVHSVTALDVYNNNASNKYLVLKHDVETKVQNAYEIAKIESKYSHKGSFYVQAYLLDNENNIALLKKIKEMGHEVSYHYDVMDSNKGNIDLAVKEFQINVEKFRSLGFEISTVCQHGNPVVERIGYTSNRDFFRNSAVQNLYPYTADIMVNFKEKANTDYNYISDAGRKFKLIFDPINNDIISSDDKNIEINDFTGLIGYITKKNSIVSIHPHRWVKSALENRLRRAIFLLIRAAAKVAIKIPFIKTFMSKYYHLSKKL